MKFNVIKKFIIAAACVTAAMPAMDLESQITQNFRVMTFNIRREGSESTKERLWENRKKAVTQMLQRKNSVIFGLQEATQQQIADLKDSLKKYEVFGEGRGTSWGGRGTDEYSPIFYDKSKLTKEIEGTFTLNPEFKQTGIMSLLRYIYNVREVGLLPRICTYALFKHNPTNKKFYLFNTHLDHKFDQARLKQLGVILEKIKSVNNKKYPVVLMGDFNANITGNIAALLKTNGFVNTRVIAQTKMGPDITQRGWSGDEKKVIDHIFLKDDQSNAKSFVVGRHTVLEPKKDVIWSDHSPVMIDLSDKK